MTLESSEIQKLSEKYNFTSSELKQLHVLEGIIRRVAASPHHDELVLRGGMMSRHWYNPGKWMPSDIDFMVNIPLNREEMESVWKTVFLDSSIKDGIQYEIETLKSEVIWAEAKDPGLRLFISAKIDGFEDLLISQIDISYSDPTVPDADFRNYPCLFSAIIPNVKMVHKETSAGWKFYGLFERKNYRWRAKDLFGLYWLLKYHELDVNLLMDSFRETSIVRGTPLGIAARFFEREFAQGKESKRIWRSFVRSHPSFELPTDVDIVIQFVREILQPYFVNALEHYSEIVEVGSNGFPTIHHFNEVLLAIKDRNEFQVIEREEYRVVDYLHVLKYSFLSANKAMHPSVAGIYALRRECRGLTFDKEGILVQRKLHKFFSIGEVEETKIENIDWTQECRILEKLDGSLVAPVIWNGNLKWTTRKGPSRVSQQAADYAKNKTNELQINNPESGYLPFVHELLNSGWTPCFEWCSRKHSIVLDYEKDQLVLIAVRNMLTGNYLNFETMVGAAIKFEIPVVQTKGIINNIEEAKSFIDSARQEKIGEGYILRFPDDRFYKVKNDYYLKLHQLVANSNKEIYIWRATISGEINELLDCVAPSLQSNIRLFSDELDKEINRFSDDMEKLIINAHTEIKKETKTSIEANKIFANKYAATFDLIRRRFVFILWHQFNSMDKSFNPILTIKPILLEMCRTKRGLNKIKTFIPIDFKEEIN